MPEILLNIGAIVLQISLLVLMLASVCALVDMFFDGYVRIGKASFLLMVFGLCIYGLNSMTGY